MPTRNNKNLDIQTTCRLCGRKTRPLDHSTTTATTPLPYDSPQTLSPPRNARLPSTARLHRRGANNPTAAGRQRRCVPFIVVERETDHAPPRLIYIRPAGEHRVQFIVRPPPVQISVPSSRVQPSKLINKHHQLQSFVKIFIILFTNFRNAYVRPAIVFSAPSATTAIYKVVRNTISSSRQTVSSVSATSNTFQFRTAETYAQEM